MNDIALQGDIAAPAPVLPAPKLRMDKSRAFATVHGERGPSDRHAGVGFIQDGLLFDSQGICIIDHPDHKEPGPEGDKRRKMLDRKLKKALAQQAKEKPKFTASAESDGDGDEDEDDTEKSDDEDEDGLLEPINLEAWLRGEQEVEWQEVTQEIARRYKKRVAKVEDAVAFLVTEGVCPKGQLRKKFLKFAD